jgi:hypothetical protein
MNWRVARNEIAPLIVYAMHDPVSPKAKVSPSVHEADSNTINKVRAIFSLSLLVMISIDPDQAMSEKM